MKIPNTSFIELEKEINERQYELIWNGLNDIDAKAVQVFSASGIVLTLFSLFLSNFKFENHGVIPSPFFTNFVFILLFSLILLLAASMLLSLYAYRISKINLGYSAKELREKLNSKELEFTNANALKEYTEEIERAYLGLLEVCKSKTKYVRLATICVGFAIGLVCFLVMVKLFLLN